MIKSHRYSETRNLEVDTCHFDYLRRKKKIYNVNTNPTFDARRCVGKIVCVNCRVSPKKAQKRKEQEDLQEIEKQRLWMEREKKIDRENSIRQADGIIIPRTSKLIINTRSSGKL